MAKRSPEGQKGPKNSEGETRELVGPEYFVKMYAEMDPSDLEFTEEQRLDAFDRAVKALGISGKIESKNFDALYEHYRWEIGLLRHMGNEPTKENKTEH